MMTGNRSSGFVADWRLVVLLLCGLTLVAFATCGATEIYVSVDGSDDAGDGSPGNPYMTIFKAIGAGGMFDTIVLLPGRYVENVYLSFDQPMNIVGEQGAEQTTIEGGIAYAGTSPDTRVLLKGVRIVNGMPGILASFMSPDIIECHIDSCQAGEIERGGGIYLDNSAAEIRNCRITNCSAIYRGGGIYSYNSIPRIIDCDISWNKATDGSGGGIALDGTFTAGSELPVIANCIIMHNNAVDFGGGIFAEIGPSYVINNLIAENQIEAPFGAGISIGSTANCEVYNNIVRNNFGDGVYCISSVDGAVGFNCFYQNTGDDIEAICVNIGYNLFQDPLQVDYAKADYHLTENSPLINSGLTVQVLPEVDFDGQKRVVQDEVDIGPDEFADCNITSDFTATPMSGCSPLNVRFDSYATGRYDSLYWDFGDGQTASDVTQVFHSFSAVGTYTVKLYAITPCTTAIAIKEDSIRVVASPQASFTAAPVSGCAPLTVEFTDESIGEVNEWLWRFGDGSTSTEQSPTHTYREQGTYSVRLKVTNDCATDSVTAAAYINVSGQAMADFVADTTSGSVPLNVMFTDLSLNDPFEWSWDFGDGGTSSEQNPAHLYEEPGVYTVWLASLNDCGVFDTMRVEDYITVAGFEVNLTDTLHTQYSKSFYFDVDTLFGYFERDISVRASIYDKPVRGAARIVLQDSTMTAGMSSVMTVYLSRDYAAGFYGGELACRSDVGGYEVTMPFDFEAFPDPIISVSPSSLDFDSVEVGSNAAIPVRVRNLSDLPDTLLDLSVSNISFDDATAFSVDTAAFNLAPNSFVDVLVTFAPPDTGEYMAVMMIISDDPALPSYSLDVYGLGVPEREPPSVRATSPGNWEDDVLMSSQITVDISEPLDTMFVAPEALVVADSHTGEVVNGEFEYLSTMWSLRFTPFGLLEPLDTFLVTVSGDLQDESGNTLDGNGDGVGEGSPVDDYSFSFVTGPGVYPGDANNDGIVNEVDVLPLGVHWMKEGPPRVDGGTHWNIQPANSWESLSSTYADCNGDGAVNQGDLQVIEINWGKTHEEVTVRFAYDESDLKKSQGAFEAIDFAVGGGSNEEFVNSIRNLIDKYVETESQPDRFSLSQNFPNPFNPSTYIQYNLPKDCHVVITIHNVLGQTVATLLDESESAGYKRVEWNGKSDSGETLPSGIYFYRLTAGGFSQVKKMMLLR